MFNIFKSLLGFPIKVIPSLPKIVNPGPPWLYDDKYWCTKCEEVTTHHVISGTHERDSSNDSIECKMCGNYQFGHNWHDENPNEN